MYGCASCENLMLNVVRVRNFWCSFKEICCTLSRKDAEALAVEWLTFFVMQV